MRSGQIVHSKNLMTLMGYVDRKGHWVCRMDIIGQILEVVSAGRAAGPPRPSEFAFSSDGLGVGVKTGSLMRLSAHQSNYTGILVNDLCKLCTQRREARGTFDLSDAHEGTEHAASAAASAGASSSCAGGGGSGGSTKRENQKKAERLRREEASREGSERRDQARHAELEARQAEHEATQAVSQNSQSPPMVTDVDF